MCTEDSYPKKFILREEGKLGSKHAVKFSKGTWHQIKIRERKGPSRGIIQQCEPHERSPCAPKFWERSHEETLQQERCARRVAWDLANKLNNSDKATFYTPIEARVIASTHFEKTRGARIRSRFGSINAHDEQKELSSEELDTSRRSRNSTVVLTANGEVHTNEEAQAHVHDLNTLAVQSLGKLCEDHGYSYEWVSGQKPQLTKEVRTTACKTDNFVTLVVPGLSTSSGSNSFRPKHRHRRICRQQIQLKSEVTNCSHEGGADQHQKPKTKLDRDDSRDADDRLRDLPEWLEEFTGNPEDTEVRAPAHISQDSDSERPTKVVSK